MSGQQQAMAGSCRQTQAEAGRHRPTHAESRQAESRKKAGSEQGIKTQFKASKFHTSNTSSTQVQGSSVLAQEANPESRRTQTTVTLAQVDQNSNIVHDDSKKAESTDQIQTVHMQQQSEISASAASELHQHHSHISSIGPSATSSCQQNQCTVR